MSVSNKGDSNRNTRNISQQPQQQQNGRDMDLGATRVAIFTARTSAWSRQSLSSGTAPAFHHIGCIRQVRTDHHSGGARPKSPTKLFLFHSQTLSPHPREENKNHKPPPQHLIPPNSANQHTCCFQIIFADSPDYIKNQMRRTKAVVLTHLKRVRSSNVTLWYIGLEAFRANPQKPCQCPNITLVDCSKTSRRHVRAGHHYQVAPEPELLQPTAQKSGPSPPPRTPPSPPCSCSPASSSAPPFRQRPVAGPPAHPPALPRQPATAAAPAAARTPPAALACPTPSGCSGRPPTCRPASAP